MHDGTEDGRVLPGIPGAVFPGASCSPDGRRISSGIEQVERRSETLHDRTATLHGGADDAPEARVAWGALLHRRESE